MSDQKLPKIQRKCIRETVSTSSTSSTIPFFANDGVKRLRMILAEHIFGRNVNLIIILLGHYFHIFFEIITLSSEYLLGSGCHVRHSRPQSPKKIFHLSRGESKSIQILHVASKMHWNDCSDIILKFDLNNRAYVFVSVSHHHMVVGHSHKVVCLT